MHGPVIPINHSSFCKISSIDVESFADIKVDKICLQRSVGNKVN